jgi:transglutaminase-like putative cysteine protease
MMRPREGHDIRIVRGSLRVEPQATVRWLRDIYNNSIVILTFSEQSQTLRILGEAEIDYMRDSPIECLIDPGARFFPFQYAPEEQVELIQYRLPSYPYDGPKLQAWLNELYRPGQTIETFDLLKKLNSYIHASLQYNLREDPGVQRPCDTLVRGSGSCRDFAVLMMEAVRHWGFGSRFVSGYIQMGEGQHGATHAWTEVYLPGAGWHGFDPTNNKMVGSEHIPVAVAREQEKASPVSGVWEGPANAFNRMDVSVQVVSL